MKLRTARWVVGYAAVGSIALMGWALVLAHRALFRAPANVSGARYGRRWVFKKGNP